MEKNKLSQCSILTRTKLIMKAIFSITALLSLTATLSATTHHKDLSHTISQLDTDGEHFSIKKIDKDLAPIITLMDHMLLYTQQIGSVPHLSFKNFVGGTGVSTITSMGQSAKRFDYGWSNKTYFEHPNKGLLQAFTKNQGAWKAAHIAPANSCAVFEVNVSLKETIPFWHACLHSLVYSKDQNDKPNQMLAMPITPTATDLTIRKFLETTNIHISGMAKLEPTETIGDENFGYPGVSAALCIQGLPLPFLKMLSQDVPQGFKKETDGANTFYVQDKPVTTLFSNTQKCAFICVDSKNTVWISTSKAYYNEVHTCESKLADSDHYKKSIARTKAKGSTLLYLSPTIAKSVIKTTAEFEHLLGKGEGAAPLRQLGRHLTQDLHDFFKKSDGYCLTISSDKKGSLIHEISPLSNKHLSLSSCALIGAFTAIKHEMEKQMQIRE